MHRYVGAGHLLVLQEGLVEVAQIGVGGIVGLKIGLDAVGVAVESYLTVEGKWRVLSKPYQPVATNKIMPNRDNWTQRHSGRGTEYFKELITRGITVNSFYIYITRQRLHLNSC